MLKPIVYVAIGPIGGGGQLWLESFLGFEARVVKLKLKTDYRVKNSPNLGEARAVPRLCKLYPGIYFTTEENHVKTSVRILRFGRPCIVL